MDTGKTSKLRRMEYQVLDLKLHDIIDACDITNMKIIIFAISK